MNEVHFPLNSAGQLQVPCAHLPLTTHHFQDGLRVRSQYLPLFGSRNAPQRLKSRYQTSRDKSRSSPSQLAVENAASAHHLILQHPGKTAFRILLHIARHMRITAPTNGDEKRW